MANELVVAVVTSVFTMIASPAISRLMTRAASQQDAARRLRWRLGKLSVPVRALSVKLDANTGGSMLRTIGPRILKEPAEQLERLLEQEDGTDEWLADIEDEEVQRMIVSAIDGAKSYSLRIREFVDRFRIMVSFVDGDQLPWAEIDMLRQGGVTAHHNLNVAIRRLRDIG